MTRGSWSSALTFWGRSVRIVVSGTAAGRALMNVSETPSNPIARFFDATSSLGPTELSFPSLCVSYARKRQMQQMLDTVHDDVAYSHVRKERELKEQIKIAQERERGVLRAAKERAHRLAQAANMLGLVPPPKSNEPHHKPAPPPLGHADASSRSLV